MSKKGSWVSLAQRARSKSSIHLCGPKEVVQVLRSRISAQWYPGSAWDGLGRETRLKDPPWYRRFGHPHFLQDIEDLCYSFVRCTLGVWLKPLGTRLVPSETVMTSTVLFRGKLITSLEENSLPFLRSLKQREANPSVTSFESGGSLGYRAKLEPISNAPKLRVSQEVTFVIRGLAASQINHHGLVHCKDHWQARPALPNEWRPHSSSTLEPTPTDAR